jgi:D-glycero-alpha-D-manno-heptose 1-phosphate guanylyltransferase
MNIAAITLLVLAGGKGTRLSAVYPDIPKPLVPVAGSPFLSWLLAYFEKAGFVDIVLSTGHLAPKIEDYVKGRPPAKLPLRTKHEDTPLGTGGGIVNALPVCQDYVLATNGDSLALIDLKNFIDSLEQKNYAMLLAGVWQDDAARYGTLDIGENGDLISFREKQPGAGYVNAGLYLFRKDIMATFPAGVSFSMEYDIVPALLKAGHKIGAFKSQAVPMIDIGLPETAAAAGDFIKKYAGQF